MELFLSLLLFAAHWGVYSADQFEVQLVSGAQWVFTGDTVILKCVLVDGVSTDWSEVEWYRNAQQLPGNKTQDLSLWRVTPDASGTYSCKGRRVTSRGPIYTLISKGFVLDVDGGWAILRLEEVVRVGETPRMTCLVRDNPLLDEVILYKDGQKVLTQRGPSADMSLAGLTLQDTGSYWCRALWDSTTGWQSARSKPVKMSVVETLTEPELRVRRGSDLPDQHLQLTCKVVYRPRLPAPSLVYYFYKDGKRISGYLTVDTFIVRDSPGVFTCRASVKARNLERWSKPKTEKGEAAPLPQPEAVATLQPAKRPDPTPHRLQPGPASSPPPLQTIHPSFLPWAAEPSMQPHPTYNLPPVEEASGSD